MALQPNIDPIQQSEPAKNDAAELYQVVIQAGVDQVQYDVFVRKARNTARQCLFFLYDLKDLGDYPHLRELDEDRAFALRQIQLLVNGVHIPNDVAEAVIAAADERMPRAAVAPHTRSRFVDFFVERDGAPPELFELSDALLGKQSRRERLSQHMANRADSSKERIALRARARAQVIAFWTRRVWLAVLAQDAQLTEGKTTELIAQVQAFLRITRPLNPVMYFTMLVQKLGALALRNVAVLVGCLALIMVWLQEAVSSLVLNGGMHSLWPFLLVSLSGAASVLVGKFAHLRLGKSAFFRVAFHAEEPERGIDSWDESSKMRQLIGRSELKKLGLMFVWMGAWGFGFWLIADPTQRTLFTLAALSWGVLVALHWLDLWDFLDPRPIRFLVLLGLIVFVFGVLGGWHREAAYFVFGGTLAVWLINGLRKRRMSEVSVLGALSCAAVIISLALGGGTYDRGVWGRPGSPNATRFQRVKAQHWPLPGAGAPNDPVVVIAASGGGSRAAIYTALTLRALHEDLEPIARNIQAISSVSGGSLATAAYVAERMDHGASLSRAQLDDFVESVEKDFLYPTLMGALKPFSSRGDAIENYWDENVHLKQHSLGELAARWTEAATKAAPPPFPMPMFNASTLDGHAVVITPLAGSAYIDQYDGASRVEALRAEYFLLKNEKLTWVLDRDRIYPLESLTANTNPRLSQAVRASANFPFGFPLVDVETDSAYPLGSTEQPENHLVQLTDGGVLSNSGMWSMFHLLTHVEKQASLKQRGVLLIVVDASKMPTYIPDRRNFANLYGAIGDQDPIGQNMHRKLFELLFQSYGESIQIVKVDLVPSVDDNVYTTWALDPRSRARLKASFDRVWNDQNAKAHVRDKLAAAWKTLSSLKPEPVPASNERAKLRASAADMLRPPLD